MQQQGKREAQVLVDDGCGTVEIWRIEDFEMVPLDTSLYGQFFGGDSYVMLYTYLINGKENYIIYFWQGQVSGALALCWVECAYAALCVLCWYPWLYAAYWGYLWLHIGIYGCMLHTG